MLVLHSTLPAKALKRATRAAQTEQAAFVGPDGDGTSDVPKDVPEVQVVQAQNVPGVRSSWRRSLDVAPHVLRISESAQQFLDARGIELSPSSLLLMKANDTYWYHLRVYCGTVEQVWRAAEHCGAKTLTTLAGDASYFATGERPAFDFLFGKDDWATYLVAKVAREMNLGFESLRAKASLPTLRPKARSASLFAAKMAILGRRAIRALPEVRAERAKVRRLRGRPWILMLVRGASEWYTLRPILRRIEEEGRYETLVVADEILRSPSSVAALESSGQPFIDLHTFASATMLPKVARSAMTARQAWRALEDWTPPPSDGCNTLDRLVFDDATVVRRSVATQLHAAAEQTLFVEELAALFETATPALVATPCMLEPWGFSLRAVCEQYSIPVLTLQNAVLSRHSVPRLVFGNRLAVSGAFVRDWMTEAGADAEAVVPTGLPMLDYGAQLRADRAALRRRHGMEEDEFVVAITSQAWDDQPKERNEALLRFAAEACNELPRCRIVLKLHPREKPGTHDAFVRELRASVGVRLDVTELTDVHEFLACADLLFTRVSTTIMSALAMGCPVAVLYDFWTETFQTDYLQSSAVRRTSEPKQLTTYCESLRNDSGIRAEYESARQDYLKTSLGTVDGGATTRIIELMHKMIEVQS